MTGKTHAACGTSALLAVTVNQSLFIPGVPNRGLYAVGLVTVALGSLLPDIDIPESKIGRMVPFISKRLTHRGITHTLVIPAILYYIVMVNMNNLLIGGLTFGILAGWVLHIFADMFNRKGVPILYPLMTVHFHIATIKTRGFGEKIFLVVWCLACAALAGFHI